MSNIIKIINNNITGSTGLRLLNGDFGYAWKNEVTSNPVENSFDNVEALFAGWENPIINLTFYIPLNSGFADGSTYMNWEKWNEIAKNQYDGTTNTQNRLDITVSGIQFTDYSTTSTAVTSIPFMVKSYNLKFSPGDSFNSSFWTVSAQLLVTK